MKLVADESVDAQIVARLRADGHDVISIAEGLPGVSDLQVIKLAADSGAMLVTSDKDFGELVYRQRIAHQGVLLIRLHGLSASPKSTTVAEALSQHAAELLKEFSVLSPGALRIRRST